jgi:hypothetical protein
MSETNKAPKKEVVKKDELDRTITGIDIDKNEYHEIVLSNSNHPEKDFYRGYYD